MSKCLFDKIWEKHIVKSIPNGPDVLFIDRHLIHEVTSPQAFEKLKQNGLDVKYPQRMLATADHNVPTTPNDNAIQNAASANAVATLERNCSSHGIQYFGMGHEYQGIVHVIGPELGFSLPGMTIVCGDSHTSTHGAFGSIAFGIGTSEVAMVMASQSLLQDRPKTMRISIDGKLGVGVTAKDVILYLIRELGTDGGNGYFIEFAGETIRDMSMEARMTLCNMSIEMGARGALIAPDKTTFSYIQNRLFSPSGEQLERLKEYWKTLYTDPAASFQKEYHFTAAQIAPMITYGTNPSMSIAIDESIPLSKHTRSNDTDKALSYMGFKEGQELKGHKISHVFIGSCTNARIEDLRIVRDLVKGKKLANGVKALVVPGSRKVRNQAIQEGIGAVLEEAGFEFREPGCSSCLAMNNDKVPPEAYCVSTSNRNFEGRQGVKARTILASPAMAAVAALTGSITDVRQLSNYEKA